MRKLALLGVVLITTFVLGAWGAQAQSCYGPYGPTGGTMWRWWNLTRGYTYTVTVTNLSSYGWVYLWVWDYCWKDSSGRWWCNGLVNKSGPWTSWASIWFTAWDSEYFVWVVATGNYRICFW